MSSEQLTELARPFNPKYVMKPPQGKYGSYVPHEIVEQKILVVLGPHDFEVLEFVLSPEGIVEGCRARMTLVIDGVSHTVTEVGDCEIPTNWKTQGARMKDCASDAYKRCAMRFGVGLHLWAQENFFLYDYLISRAVAKPAPGLTSGEGEPAAPDLTSGIGEVKEENLPGLAVPAVQGSPAAAPKISSTRVRHT